MSSDRVTTDPSLEQRMSASGPGGRPSALRWQVGWVVGVAILIAGTFLPWVYSGRVAKSSYSITGSLERHLNLPTWGEALVTGWPLLGPLLAVLVAMYALGLRRTAAWLAAIVLLLLVLLAGGLLLVGGRVNGPISIATLGPVVTGLGGIVGVVCSIKLALLRPNRPHDLATNLAPGGNLL